MRNVGRVGVCLLCDTLGRDAGTERQVFSTARRLDQTKFDVHVCCLEPSLRLSALANYCHTAVFPTDSAISWRGIREAARFRQYLRRHRIQIVHAYMNKTAIFAVCSSLLSNRIVITSRLNTGYWYTPVWRTFFRVLNRGTTRVMANSEEAKRIAVKAEHLPASKVDVVYQGVDMNVFRQGFGEPAICERLGIPGSWKVVGIVANLRPVKDIPLFLRAAAIVARELPEVAFLIIGEGEQLQELQNLARELGLQGRAFFTRGDGFVMDYLAGMSVGCLTSKSEGFSNVILEYMAAGLPVVATDVGGNREAILNGQTGYLVGERAPEAFAKPLLQLLTHEGLRQEMGQRNYERCLEDFELSKTIKSLEDYYCSLLPDEPGD